MSNSRAALTCSARATNNFLCWDISCCNYSRGEQQGQGTPAPCVQHHLPCMHPLAIPDQSCSSTFPLKSPFPKLFSLKFPFPKVSLARGQAKEKKILGREAKQDHLIEVLRLPTGFLLILQEEKPAELPATTARHLNNNNLQTSKVKPNEQLWCLQQTLPKLLVSSLHLSPSQLIISFLHHHLSLLPGFQTVNYLLVLAVLLLGSKRTRQIGLCRSASVKYHIKRVETTTKRFPHGLQHRYIIKKGAKVPELQPQTPWSQWRQWPCRHEAHPGTEGTAFLGASWSHCPQRETICRHANCFRKLKYICSYNLALISLFKSYQKLVGDFFFVSFFGVGVFFNLCASRKWT